MTITQFSIIARYLSSFDPGWTEGKILGRDNKWRQLCVN